MSVYMCLCVFVWREVCYTGIGMKNIKVSWMFENDRGPIRANQEFSLHESDHTLPRARCSI